MKANKQIEPKDVRVGNYVRSKLGTWLKLKYIPEEFHPGDFAAYPIPLTPEILEKAGFEKNYNGMYWLGDSTEETGGYMYDGYELYYFHYDCPNESYALKLPLFLHWLQNHHYFTRGEELNIEL